MYRLSIFNASASGMWITVGEYASVEEAVSAASEYQEKGYDISIGYI